MADYEGKTFRNRRVDLDGSSFHDCLFERCTLTYGGMGTVLSGNQFVDCRIEASGAFRLGLEFARDWAHQGDANLVDAMANGLAAIIRADPGKATFVIH